MSERQKSPAEIINDQRDEQRFGDEHKPRLAIDGVEFKDEYFEEEIENLGEMGMCKKCKEMTEIGNSCCGDEYVHID